MSDRDKTRPAIADRAADVTLSAPTVIGRGFMTYERYDVSIARHDDAPLQQQRDVLRASRVAAVLPVDIISGEVVLLHQFRLPAHLVTGRGEMVEIVAGRVDHDESALIAASRECMEEIGVAPDRLIELYSVLPTPGFTDEFVTFFLGFVDAAQVPTRGGLVGETEDTRPFVVSIDEAISALDSGAVFNGLMVSALQWLALHRERLQEFYDRATPAT
ncbi:MAG: Nucleoside diphosphate pyrophosphatase [Tardiphaga sp.]|uniref:NUDIX domain-containing protein n=1 Tax=Tardiphaga sp. TaxID=1926292 RepID=UPI00261B45A5|nr:NUDIX hydrolase [Tardiphaga sp.]MDB5502071.1 Nucleoside diphosphate pyrophosphatase [Tardiphaga sp.]